MHQKSKKTITPLSKHPSSFWIYGVHTVLAAVTNPKRSIHRLCLVYHDHSELREEIEDLLQQHHPKISLESVDNKTLDQFLPREAVHQGIAALVSPLPTLTIEDLDNLPSKQPSRVVIVLDQVTDPHNVGAIIRTACVFGVDALIMPAHHQAPLEAIVAKSASGGLEKLPVITVTNLSRSLEILKKQGYWCLGLDETGSMDLLTWVNRSLSSDDKIALIFGSEGKGLRTLTKERCDLLIKLPHYGPMSTLNVSNAVAVSLTMVCPQLKSQKES